MAAGIGRGVALALLLAATARAQTSQSDCAIRYQRAIAAGAPAATAAYNQACCLALAGEKSSALDMLMVAARLGWSEAEWARADTDLLSLHDDPRWPAVLARLQENEDAHLICINPELYHLFNQDQGDRHKPSVDWKIVAPRDEARRKRVYELIRADALRDAEDYYHAALILQHGSASDDFAMAVQLSLRALDLRPNYREAAWLSAAATDRWLWHEGRPQIYGTQIMTIGKELTMEPWDRAAVTDQQRLEKGVPPAREIDAGVARMKAARKK